MRTVPDASLIENNYLCTLMKRFNAIVFLIVAIGTLSACRHQISHGNIPAINVYFKVYPYGWDNTLLTAGSVKYFDYGYMGVCVYHIGYMDEEYVAFEQACPWDWEKGCMVEYDREIDRMVGKRCGYAYSSFNGYGYSPEVRRYALRKYPINYAADGSFVVSN